LSATTLGDLPKREIRSEKVDALVYSWTQARNAKQKRRLRGEGGMAKMEGGGTATPTKHRKPYQRVSVLTKKKIEAYSPCLKKKLLGPQGRWGNE